MSRAGVVGLARVVLSSRERQFLVEAMGNGLRGVILRFAHEVRSEADYFGDIPEIKLPADMMKLAQHIIKTKSDGFRCFHVGGSLPDRTSAHSAQETGEAPRSSGPGKTGCGKRGEFNGRSTPQHRRREAPGREIGNETKRREIPDQAC